MQCPDGSYVGRTGPNCEFAACPGLKFDFNQIDTSGWKTYRNDEYGFEFRYPNDIVINAKTNWSEEEFALTVSENTLEGFKYEDATAGVRYIYDTKQSKWIYTPQEDYYNNDKELLQRLFPQDLDLGFEAYKYGGGNGFCGWDSYLIPISWDNKMIEIAYSICGDPPSDKNSKLFDLISPKILSTFKFIETSGSGGNVKTTGVAFGKISIGPLCPVEPCINPVNPFVGKKLIFTPTNGSKAFYADISPEGVYWTDLPAGDYSVTLSECQYMGCSSVLPRNIRVDLEGSTKLDIDIDTGIR